MKHLKSILYILLISSNFTLTGCRSNDGGYRGPDSLKWHSISAMEIAVAELNAMYGLGLEVKERWVRVREVSPIGTQGGYPIIAYPLGGHVGAYTDPNKMEAVVPDRGLTKNTLIHEMGHLALYAHLIRSADKDDHHRRYPRFFRKYTYGGEVLN